MDTLDFGLFDSLPGLFNLVHQSMPVIWIALVSLCPVLLSEFLRMLWCVQIPQDGVDGSVTYTSRLLPSPDIECWGGTHFPSAVVAIVGLVVWCAGIPGILAIRLFFLGERQSPDNFRKYGYFIQGYEAHFWWWDIIIKNFDVGVMMVITYTSLVPAPEAKLLCYPVLSGLQFGMTAWLAPFSNQQAGILDVLEVALQTSRFIVFSVVAALMILSLGEEATVGLALVVLVLVTAVAAYLVIHVAAQQLRDASQAPPARPGNALMKFVGALISGGN